MSRRKKNWSRIPDGGLTPRLTGRPTVGRSCTRIHTCKRVFIISGGIIYTRTVFFSPFFIFTKFLSEVPFEKLDGLTDRCLSDVTLHMLPYIWILPSKEDGLTDSCLSDITLHMLLYIWILPSKEDGLTDRCFSDVTLHMLLYIWILPSNCRLSTIVRMGKTNY
jgi:hypothetical protein